MTQFDSNNCDSCVKSLPFTPVRSRWRAIVYAGQLPGGLPELKKTNGHQCREFDILPNDPHFSIRSEGVCDQ